MAIHWFPGHMATARAEIRKQMPEVDLVIEVLDARIPHSSENPLVAPLRGNRPCIQVLNKADLADPAHTATWLDILEQTPGIFPLVHQLGQAPLLPRILAIATRALPNRVDRIRPLAAMILGIPNVGKSTIINGLTGRPLAKTGDRPAVTKAQQRIAVGNRLVLFDTPGFLWQKFTPPVCGYRLAATGAISERVVDYQDVAAFLVPELLVRYPLAIQEFYGVAPIESPEAALPAIARKRGFLVKGGIPDLARCAEQVIRDFRGGKLGRLTLELPHECRSVPPADG